MCVRVRVSVCPCGCLCSRVRLFDVFCGFGTGVLTHRCWYEDSSIGCGFHEVSFPVTACMLTRSDLTNRNSQSNTIVLVRLFLSCGTRIELVVTRRACRPLHFQLLAHFLEYHVMLTHTASLQVPEQFHILLRRVPPQSVQFFGRVRVQFVFRWFGFVIPFDVFGIRWFSRFLDGRAISAV